MTILEVHRGILRISRTRKLLETFFGLLCIQFSRFVIHYLLCIPKSPSASYYIHNTKAWPLIATKFIHHRSSRPEENEIIPNPFLWPHPILHSRFPGLADAHLDRFSWGQGMAFDEHGCQESLYSQSHVKDGVIKKVCRGHPWRPSYSYYSLHLFLLRDTYCSKLALLSQ